MADYKRPSYEAVVTAEYRLLNALVKKPDYINDPRVFVDLFVDETAKSIFEGIESLYKRGITPTEAALLQACNEIDYNVTRNEIISVINIDDNGANTLDDIIPVLKNEINKKVLLEKIDRLKKLASKDGMIDYDSLQKDIYSIEDDVKKSNKNTSDILSFREMADEYKEDLDRRKTGQKYSFGDYGLDEAITKGAIPGRMTMIVASTNMGKSTYGLNMVMNLMETGSPCMYVSLEMGMIDTIDRMLVNRVNSADMTNKTLYDPMYIDSIKDLVDAQVDRIGDSKFCFCRATGVSTVKLRQLIKEFKQKTNSDYALIMIDLVSGLTDYMTGAKGGNSASSIELCMNRLEDIAKAENVHIVGIAQLNRQSDAGYVKSFQEINNLRPALSDIKNSGAIAEKATTVISLFRPKYYADRYLSNSPEFKNAVDSMDDVLEATILKDRDAPAGTVIQYDFVGSKYLVVPRSENAPIMSLNELDKNVEIVKMQKTPSFESIMDSHFDSI